MEVPKGINKVNQVEERTQIRTNQQVQTIKV